MWYDIKAIVRYHFLYIVCTLIYLTLGGFLLGGTLNSFLIATGLYAVSVLIALSPIGEGLFRLAYGVHPVETGEDKEYLRPIFKEIINAVPVNKKPIRIHVGIIDKMEVNACAIGKHTVAVTRGAIEVFTEDQLKGVIAHELGHIWTRDTVASIFLLVSNGYYYLFALFVNIFIYLLDKVSTLIGDRTTGQFLCSVLRFLFKIVNFFFSFPIKAVVALESRRTEYRADQFAYELGYGEELKSALYLLRKISLGDNSDLIKKMMDSHPRLTARIEQLEVYIEDE